MLAERLTGLIRHNLLKAMNLMILPLIIMSVTLQTMKKPHWESIPATGGIPCSMNSEVIVLAVLLMSIGIRVI